MSPVAENLKSTLLELSIEDRAGLAAFLLHSLDDRSGFNFDEYWIGELSRRDAEIRSGVEVGTPAEQVFADLKAKLRGPDEILGLAVKVYDGLSEADRNEVEVIATARPPTSPSLEKTYETRTPAERVEALLAWADSRKDDTAPLLTDEAISRESIYERND